MTHKTVAWTLGEESGVTRLDTATLDYEKHLESWIERDPEIIGGDVLLVGRQQKTDFGGIVDLLGIGPEGELIIIELKRDRTLRETVAQALEYAAWGSQLTYDRIVGIASDYHGGTEKFTSRFQERFETDPPEVFNQTQRILLVAPEITDGVRAVVEYLAETYSVPINAVSFSLFDADGLKVLVREVVLSDDEVVTSGPSKKRSAPTIDSLLAQADKNGVGDITRYLWSLHDSFPTPQRYINGWGFRLKVGKLYRSVFTVFPVGTKQAKDRVVISMRASNLAELFSRTQPECQEFIKQLATSVGQPEASPWEGWDRFSLQTVEAAKKFTHELRQFTGLKLLQESESK